MLLHKIMYILQQPKYWGLEKKLDTYVTLKLFFLI